MKLYQFAIIKHPTEKDREDNGARSELLVDVQSVLADSDRSALLLAARAIPQEHADDLDRIEVAVSPF